MRKRLKKKLNRKARVLFFTKKGYAIAGLVIKKVAIEMEVVSGKVHPMVAIGVVGKLMMQITFIQAQTYNPKY